MPCARQNLKIILRALEIDLSHNLSIRILIISWPWAYMSLYYHELILSSLLTTFLTFSIEKSTSKSDLSLFREKYDENSFAKKELIISFFSLWKQS